MGVFGFGKVGGAVADEGTAGFPTSGLVALYKCDETGDRMLDATGTLTPITLNTGIALDCTSVSSYLVDATSLHSDFDGEALDATVACEIVTPALAATNTIHRIVSGTTATSAPVHVFLAELAYAGGNRFGIHTRLRTNVDAAGVTNKDLNLGTLHFPGLAPSTAYQIVIRFSLTGTKAYARVFYRPNCSGEWFYFEGEYTTTGTAHIMSATGAFQALAYGAATERFQGKCSAVMIARAMSLTTAKAIMERQEQSYVAGVLASYESRYWDFRVGTGSTAREWKSTASPTIAGTPTWGFAIGGIKQSATRQGLDSTGPAGVRIGGESGFAGAVGYGTSAANDFPILASPDGWTVIATLRTGNRIPATDQYLFSVYGPREDGTYSTTPTLQPGAHLVLDDAGLIRGVFKNSVKTTAQTGTEQAAGVTADSPSNGLLGTYAIVCSSAGVVTTRRILTGETSVTEVASSTNVDHIRTRATRVAIGNASFGADLIVGFGAIYNRPITDAEIAQCHKMSVARMRGAEITVLAAATAGNGTSRYPYGVMTSAMRVMQPGQVVNVGAGTYKRISNNQPAALFPSSSTNIWIKGASMTTTIIQADASGVGNHPVELNAGSWRFSDCKFDARNISNSGVTTGTSNTVDSLIFDRCWFYDALVGTSTGTGLVTRAKYVELNDCESSHNGEHGVYLRIASQDEGDHRAVIRGLYCHDNTEDGLKFAADLHPTNMTIQASWAECIVDSVKVTGGLRQLWLGGIRDSVITNVLLIDSTNTGGIPGAFRLGHPTGTDTAEIEDGCWNNTIANVTIVGADGYAVYDARSVGTVIKNLVLSGNANDYAALSEGTAVITYAAGTDPDYPLPTHATNILGATIAFTNTGTGDYSLTAGSDGTGDGVNLTGLSDEAESTYAGVARPTTGAWNMGAY